MVFWGVSWGGSWWKVEVMDQCLVKDEREK